MYCNHRNSKRPGACKLCWRSGIVLWAVMYFLAFVFTIDKAKHDIGYWILMSGLGWIIYESYVTKWKHGDR